MRYRGTLGHAEIPERIAYAAGLRAPEAIHLKVRDIDGERGIIRVEHGKGGKDRNVMVSTQWLAILRVY